MSLKTALSKKRSRIRRGALRSTGDRWQLFDTEADFAESTDLAARYPAKLKELQALWWAEARRYSDPAVTRPVEMLYRFNRIDDAFSEPGN